jgi:hypothetical protein
MLKRWRVEYSDKERSMVKRGKDWLNSKTRRRAMSLPKEATISISNAQSAIEEYLHRLGLLGEDQTIELPWKVQQIPIKIHREQEVRVIRHNG